MSAFFELLADNASVAGRLVTTAAGFIVGFLVAMAARWLVGRRAEEAYTRYYLRKAVNVLVAVAVLVALAVVWRPFAGRVAVILGFATAGLAFAMQEVIGALAGWVSILTGRHFRVRRSDPDGWSPGRCSRPVPATNEDPRNRDRPE